MTANASDEAPMKEYAFDVKMFVVCRVKAASQARAEELLDLYGDTIEPVLLIDGDCMKCPRICKRW